MEGCGGISEVEARVENFRIEKEKRVTFRVQLNFHQKVLGVKCCQSLFAVTLGAKMKDICVLIKNLKEVISWSKDTNSNSNTEIDFSRPIFVTQAALEKGKKCLRRELNKPPKKRRKKHYGKKAYL